MSAYAALVSLLRILGTNLDSGRLVNIHNRAQLQSLLEKVIFFLHFLDNSSTHEGEASQISDLERKLRDTAYRAEDLIESQISAILGAESSRLHVLMMSAVVNFFYSFLLLSNRIPVRIPEMVPEWIKIFMLVIFIPAVAALAICVICAAGLYLTLEAINFLDLNDLRPQETQDLRVVLYELSSIANAVTRIKEDRKMSAYAALLSFRKILDPILQESGEQVYHNRSQLESLHGKVTLLIDFLGNASTYMTSKRKKSELQKLENKISHAVKRAEQLIELQMPAQFILNLDRKSFRRLMKFMLLALLSSVFALASTRFPVSIQVVVGWVITVTLGFALLALRTSVLAAGITNSETQEEKHDLSKVIDGLDIIIKNVIRIKDTSGSLSSLPSVAAAPASSFSSRRSSVVGLERDMEKIMLRLIQESPQLEVIPIVGMGGIGKTTLATQVYNHHYVAKFFDVRAWVTISQESTPSHVLLSLLDSAELPEGDEDRLGDHVHKYLKKRRYLIVMDDVWDTEVWDEVRYFLPDDRNGSRILLTSRLSNVASFLDSGSRPHHMKCLNENESWRLLHEKVFGEEDSCPSELESIGRKILEGCGGLPLAILVIGGILSKEDKKSIIWETVAKNLKPGQCLEVLDLSYKHLPHHLRPCFLYMGVFLGDSKIPVSRLINLWAAEGFLKPSAPKSSEEVAEDYLNDLIQRNLIFVCTKSCNGKNRTCSIHDLLRDVCVENCNSPAPDRRLAPQTITSLF